MEAGNREVIQFCKKCRILELLAELDELCNDMDVTYEEVRGWEEN